MKKQSANNRADAWIRGNKISTEQLGRCGIWATPLQNPPPIKQLKKNEKNREIIKEKGK